MNTLKTLFALSLVLSALTALFPAEAQKPPPPIPDMRIASVTEGVGRNPKAAQVLIENKGYGHTGKFTLSVYAMTPNGWRLIKSVTVPNISPCTSLFVDVIADGIEGNPTLYVVDPANKVKESDETNNGYEVR
jgi:subtilase family serine protease